MILYYLLQAHYLSSTGSLSMPMILYYLLLAHCLSLWYSTTFYWPPAYPYGTLLPSTGFLPFTMVLYYHLLTYCIYLWYSTTFYWPIAYTHGTLLSSTGHCIYQRTLLSSTGSRPIHMLFYYLLLDPSLYL